MATDRRRRATIHDVARESGVSRGTVSRVLNNNGYVSGAARAAVEEAIASVGYAPNSAARSLVSQRTGNVAYVVHESQEMFFNDPNLGRILTAANQVISRAGMQLVILLVDSDTAVERLGVHLRGGFVDGAILVSVRADDFLIKIVESLGLPAAMAGHPPNRSSIPWVDVDNIAGAREITLRLMDTGRSRVAMIQGPAEMRASHERLQGFQGALGDRFDSDLVVPTTDWSYQSGFSAMHTLLDRHPDVDGVFGGCDAIAVGAMDAFRSRGRDVPDDAGVVGFDDGPFARQSLPELSTVQQPFTDIGTAMATMVLRQLQGAELSNTHQILPTSVIWRESA